MGSISAGKHAASAEELVARRGEVVLVVSAVQHRRSRLAAVVEALGMDVRQASDAREAMWELEPVPPHLVLVDVLRPEESEWALDVVTAAREAGDAIAVMVLQEHEGATFTIKAFGRRADDVIVGRLSDHELAVRIAARLERRPVPRQDLLQDPVTGALTDHAFADQLGHELVRVRRGGRPGALAFLTFHELPEIEARLGPRAREELLAQVVRMIQDDGREVDFVGHCRGVLALLLPATPVAGAEKRLDRLVRLLSTRTLVAGGEARRLTPIIGYAVSEPGQAPEELEDRAWVAMMVQADQLDFHPTRWSPVLSGEPPRGSRLLRILGRARTPVQVVTQQLSCLIIPFLAYLGLLRIGVDVTGVVYLFLVCALATTAFTIWAEGIAALRATKPPEAEPGHFPRATAIIAAYLPNEAETIVESVEAMLRQSYPDLQVILAYNTPKPLPVEDELRAIAERDPRFEPLNVIGSASKAQNVNAALARVQGEIVGMFDADHQPRPDSFRRAWQWLANGYDVVQGHCVVRNGHETLVSKLVAVEFEAIYAVSHPGRARLHGFGIFGGSNGYWRTEVLRRTRMRGFMLTEDIDSSMRVVEGGGKIASDPGLVSTELAPDTVKALWNQRMRWAQGWSQVSLKHVRPMWRRPGAGLRGRFGAFHLLAWRELYPWLSLQMYPLLGVWLFTHGSTIDWFVPIFFATTLFTFSVGPAQVLFAWKLADPSIKQHRAWFALFFLVSTVVYTEWKNIIVRTGHLKELMGERTWKVTPRSARSASSGAAPATPVPAVAPAPAVEPPAGVAVERRSPDSVGAKLRPAAAPGTAAEHASAGDDDVAARRVA